jgi:hypothetical protein
LKTPAISFGGAFHHHAVTLHHDTHACKVAAIAESAIDQDAGKERPGECGAGEIGVSA